MSRISIIIPIYKVEPYIERCINSVIIQTFTDYEVILVDDASPDNALQIAERVLTENNTTFQTIKHPENRGLSEARNSGIKVAKGNYLFFIDSDDTLADTNVLEKFYTTIKQEKVDFVTANYNMVNSKNKAIQNPLVKPSKNRKLEGGKLLKALIYSELSVTAWNKLINKEFLKKEKLYFKKGIFLEDQLWSFQLCIAASSCYSLPDYSYNYYQTNPDAITANADKKFVSDYCVVLQAISKIMDFELQKNTENSNDFIFHFRNKALEILTTSFLFDNKHNWQKYYKIIQNIYKNSDLSKHKTRFSLPANLAYFVFKERIKPYHFIGSKYYLKFVDLINRYNWEGKI